MAVALAAIKFAEQQSSLVSQLREEELVQVGCRCTHVCTQLMQRCVRGSWLELFMHMLAQGISMAARRLQAALTRLQISAIKTEIAQSQATLQHPCHAGARQNQGQLPG